MEYLSQAVAWIKNNGADIVAAWTCIIGAAEIVVKWTDSKKDDEFCGKIRRGGVLLISWLTKFGFEVEKTK